MSLINLPGVPALLDSFASAALPSLLTSDSVSALIGAGAPQWGVFDQNGSPVIIAESVVTVDYRHAWRISDYPIEGGDFSDYNKVQTPYEAKLKFAQGGTEAERSAFLANLEATAASLSLYNIVTPERTYRNANITHIDYQRTATHGVSLLMADVWLEEVRVTATNSLNKTAEPGSSDPFNIGNLQSLIPSIPQISSLIAPVQAIASNFAGAVSGQITAALGGLNPTLLSSVSGWGSNLSLMTTLPGLAAGTKTYSALSNLATGGFKSWGNAVASQATSIVQSSLNRVF